MNFRVVLSVTDSNVIMFTSGLEKGVNFFLSYYDVEIYIRGKRTPKEQILRSIGHRDHFGRIGKLTGTKPVVMLCFVMYLCSVIKIMNLPKKVVADPFG